LLNKKKEEDENENAIIKDEDKPMKKCDDLETSKTTPTPHLTHSQSLSQLPQSSAKRMANKVNNIVKRTPKFYEIDYNKLKSLKGYPNINDIIAFQMLELSSNFQPELSNFKVKLEFHSKF
jgi:hypothetical protein